MGRRRWNKHPLYGNMGGAEKGRQLSCLFCRKQGEQSREGLPLSLDRRFPVSYDYIGRKPGNIICYQCLAALAKAPSFHGIEPRSDLKFPAPGNAQQRPFKARPGRVSLILPDRKETMTTSTITTPSKITRGKAAPQKRKETGPRIRPLGDLLNDDTIEPRQQLCGPWLLERGLAMVFAPTGVGKSWFAMGVAAAVSSGGTFGHWSAPEPRRVLYIDGEIDAADLKSRFQSIIRAAQDGGRDLIAENVQLFARNDQPEGDTSFPDFGNPEHTERILGHIRRVRPHLVVLDNLSTLATVDDDNAADAWDDFLKLLLRIKGLGAAVLVVHHANKGGTEYRGSSKIPVMFDAVVRLQPDLSAHDVDGAAFLLDFTKARMLTEDTGKTFNVAFSQDGWRWGTFVDRRLRELVQRILSGEFRTQREAASAIGVEPGTMSKMIRKAITAGITTRPAIDAALKAARENAEDEEEGVPHDF
jgi:hypothetical protein